MTEFATGFKWRWVCPRCETEFSAGDPNIPGDAAPPTCNWGHPPVEMEQRIPPPLDPILNSGRGK